MASRARTDGIEIGGSTLQYMKKQKTVILRLGGYLMKYRLLLALALFMTATGNLFALVGPMLSGYAVDAIEPGLGRVDFGRVFFYARWMVLFYVAAASLSYMQTVIMVTISRRVVYQMRRDVFDKLLSLPVGYFDLHQTGDIISRISYDIDLVNESLSNDLVQMLTTVITVAGSLVMMVAISPPLVLVFVITVPLSAFITRFITSRTRPLFRKRSASLGQLNGYAEEMVTGQKAIKAYCGEETVTRQFRELNRDAVEAYYQAEYYGSTVGPMVNFINNLSLSLISVLGAFLYLSGMMRAGQISSFVLYSRKFSGPINEAANIVSDLQSAIAAAERVFGLMDQLPEAPDETGAVDLVKKPLRGNVSWQDVNFSYEPERQILHNLTFEAKAGEMVAVAGPTGAGKTTLINLLMRFYDADSGEIRVDGLELHRITRKSLRKSFAMVLQDTWLFQGTVYENLVYGQEDIPREKVIEAAKAAHIHSFIMQLPEGYDTVLKEDGTNISKGQKQLLTIARAMLQDAQMLILDEATSNVDTCTEHHIQAAMRSLMKGKTCFVIAHRLSTIRNADRILVIHQGRLAEQGTHESLIAQKGFYYQMHKAGKMGELV